MAIKQIGWNIVGAASRMWCTQKTNKHQGCLLALLLCVLPLAAQDSLQLQKQTTTVRLLGIGHVNQLDTYLSPETYMGQELRYVSQIVKENGSKYAKEMVHQANISFTKNRNQNNSELGGFYNFQYNVLRTLGNWQLSKGRLLLKVGGGGDANIGFLYNARNSNNPAQVYAALNLTANVDLSYRFRIGNRPLQLRYGLQLPFLGMRYSPNYGQSYYEIFVEGDYDRNLVATTPWSAPSLRHQLTIDIGFSTTALRLGFLGDYQQAKVNHLRFHTWSNLFVVGFVKRFSVVKLHP